MKALLPGTIANGFRLKHAVNDGGGVDETTLPIRHSWEKLLLNPEDGMSQVSSKLIANGQWCRQSCVNYPSTPPRHLLSHIFHSRLFRL